MELILGNQLKTEQTQKLVLGTEMIQSLNLLQFTSSELADYISEEMNGNPVLDFGEEYSSIHQMVDADRIMNPADEWESDGNGYDERGGYDEYDGYDGYGGDYDGDSVGAAAAYSMDFYGQGGGSYDYFDTGRRIVGDSGASFSFPEGESRSLEFGSTEELTLEENLLSQLDFCSEPYLKKATAAYIIQTLDENGYMTFSPEEIAEQLNVSTELVEDARRLIWSFDPPGVAAVDLKECMKIQLETIGKLDPQIEKIIEDHLEEIARGRFSTVARAVGMTVGEVSDAAELIRSLEPKPGRSFFSAETAHYIVPDVTVEKSGGRYQVKINSHTAPRLIIRNDYRTMLRDADRDSRVADFLAERLNSASWLIRSIEHRRETMYKIVTAITEVQEEFFEKGIRYLKPMTMKQAAEMTGVHESTVSRAVNGKYLQCPQGIFELRYFFSGTSSFAGKDGQSATSEGLKSMIVKLVEAEDRASPLSDRSIAEAILIKGIAVSRRTVAKYREELGIPTSSARRRRQP